MNIKRRLVVATTILLLIIISIQGIFAISARHEQWQQFSIFGEIIADAIRNRNMSSIQNTALLVLRDLRGDWIALTDDHDKVLWSFPQATEIKHIPFRRELGMFIVSVHGNTKLLASVPIFPNETILVSLALSTLLFVTVLFWAIIGVIKRLSRNFSDELQKMVLNSGEIFITELDNTRRHINDLRVKEGRHAAMAAIGRISSHIAHDMRSPLSVIQSYVSCNSALNEAEALEYKDAASRSVGKLLRMAEGLVDYSKASRIERSAVEIEELIGEATIADVRLKARERGIDIRCNVVDSANISIDTDKMGRVLVNIINNAIQAISHDKGNIVVDAIVEGKNNLLMTISDNGKGIEEQHLPHVFEMFYTSGKKGGTGLGLSFCKQVVEAHGGTIVIRSEAGKGSTFTIRIPNCVVRTEVAI